jgi:hypothetical protein
LEKGDLVRSFIVAELLLVMETCRSLVLTSKPDVGQRECDGDCIITPSWLIEFRKIWSWDDAKLLVPLRVWYGLQDVAPVHLTEYTSKEQ